MLDEEAELVSYGIGGGAVRMAAGNVISNF